MAKHNSPMRKVDLILSPTPVHRLNHLSDELGIDLWIKRDDLTGFAMGGNKGRKLEYLIADALDNRAEVIVTCGSAQSNFVRQLAAACAMYDIKLVVVAMALPFESERPEFDAMRTDNGNVLLDEWLGAEIQLQPDGTWEELFERTEFVARSFEDNGRRVHRIPLGGSHPLGAYGFVEAANEIAEQAAPFDTIVFASSSGSTHVGLQYALRGSSTRVLGVACDPEPEIREDFAKLASGLDDLLGTSVRLSAEDFELDDRFVGPGYGVPSEAGNNALRLMAQREGIFLDPIYSAKAFAGLLAMVAEGSLSGRVLFWHTGGLPALFAMSKPS